MENSNRKVPCHIWQYQKHRHIKRMENNCHNPDLVQTFSCVEDGG